MVDRTFERECEWSSMSVRMWSECDSVENGDSSMEMGGSC